MSSLALDQNKKFIPFNSISAFVLVGAIVNDAVIVGALTWAKLIFLVVILLLLWSGISLRRIAYSEAAIVGYSGLLVFFSVFFSGAGNGERFLPLMISLLIGSVSFILVVRSKLRYPEIQFAMACWILLVSPLAMFQSLFGWGFVSDRVFSSSIIPGFYRASGLMSDPNYYALICVLFYSLISHRSTFYRIAKAFAVLGVLLSGSRSGLLSLVFVFGVGRTGFNFNFSSILKASIVAFALFLLLYFSRGHLPASISMVFEVSSYAAGAERNSLSDRLGAIIAGIEAFKDNPLFGYGLGNLVSHPLNLHGQVSHNTVIEICAENGILGLFLYMSLNLYFLKLCSSLYFVNRALSQSLMIAILIFNVMSMTLIVHYSRIMYFMFAVCYLAQRESFRFRKGW